MIGVIIVHFDAPEPTLRCLDSLRNDSSQEERSIVVVDNFGAGTIPALLLVGLLASKLGHRLRGWLYRIGGILVIVMGLYYLKLGIGFYASL